MCVWSLWRPEEEVRCPGTGKLPCGCWRLSWGPLQHQLVLLTTESSLQLLGVIDFEPNSDWIFLRTSIIYQSLLPPPSVVLLPLASRWVPQIRCFLVETLCLLEHMIVNAFKKRAKPDSVSQDWAHPRRVESCRFAFGWLAQFINTASLRSTDSPCRGFQSGMEVWPLCFSLLLFNSGPDSCLTLCRHARRSRNTCLPDSSPTRVEGTRASVGALNLALGSENSPLGHPSAGSDYQGGWDCSLEQEGLGHSDHIKLVTLKIEQLLLDALA